MLFFVASFFRVLVFLLAVETKRAARRGKRAAQGVHRGRSRSRRGETPGASEGARPRMIVGSGSLRRPPQPPRASAADGGIRAGRRGNGPRCTEAPDLRFRMLGQVEVVIRQAACRKNGRATALVSSTDAQKRSAGSGKRFGPRIGFGFIVRIGPECKPYHDAP
jgi:hypothetical protein